MCCTGFCLKILLPVVVAILLLQVYSRNREPVFSHEIISEITRDALKETKGPSVDAVLEKIHQELINQFGDHVLPSSEWVFVNCGGWMGSMYILHASLNEYVIFFGLGVDTSGHSGRYTLNITDTLVSGKMRQWKEGGLVVNEYGPGDIVVHEPWEVTGVQWTSGTVMVEYARGFIPYSLPFALADSLFSTLDFYTIFKIFKLYGRSIFNEILIGNF